MKATNQTATGQDVPAPPLGTCVSNSGKVGSPRATKGDIAQCQIGNSIRHNLSLHTRFIRVQNEGTGKSSWWMLNPEGGKAGKAPRRRAVSMDNNAKYLKSKGRVSRKKAAGGVGPGVRAGLQGSPERGSPTGKGGSAAAGGRGEEFDAWTELHSRTSSSASTLSGRLSPILAEGELEEPEEGGGLSCSPSPRLYPSPSSVRSPALGCPTVELPQLADLAGAISLEERLMKDGYHQPARHKRPAFHFGPGGGGKAQGSYCGAAYGQPAMGLLRHHTPMQTIQENKAASFQGSMRAYSGANALQNLLTAGGPPPYCAKELMMRPEGEPRAMMALPPSTTNGVGSHNHNHHPAAHHHGHNSTHNQPHSHNLNSGQSHAHVHGRPRQQALAPRMSGGLLQPYGLKAPADLYSPTAHAHLPASTALPPNPAGMLGAPQDSCHLATAPQPRHQPYQGGPPHHHHHHHHHPHQGVSDARHGHYHHQPGGGGGGGGGRRRLPRLPPPIPPPPAPPS
ncbi:hypothetical protein AAFF_G00161100 [Aldrovandia affinis]|uniref:Fork-head domain-containing protein n=1 Tax=Aldrovandia affinis TaxID=143900 RepID=A0AAD7W7G3_9TELE|nr:hypothetical protein AAFF_G00161100 [Aldrovandia affinis]